MEMQGGVIVATGKVEASEKIKSILIKNWMRSVTGLENILLLLELVQKMSCLF